MAFHTVPKELILDILSRMPIKPLFRFKCVCKTWRDQIESKEFFQLHYSRSLQTNSYNCSLLLTIYRNLDVNGSTSIVPTLYRAHLDLNNINLTLSRLVLPPSFEPSFTNIRRRPTYTRRNERIVVGNIEVAGSCNGLVLILSGLHHFAVCNPAIEQEHAFKILPCINHAGYVSRYVDSETYHVYLPLAQLNQHYAARKFELFRVFGFGYDCDSRSYKIVYLTPTKALVYSLMKDGHSWSDLNLPDLKHSSTYSNEKKLCIQVRDHGVATNNHIHWDITEYDPQIVEYVRETILSFNLHNEEWGEVSLPNELNQAYHLKLYIARPYIMELGVLDGCLCLLTSRGISYPYLDIWIMKEYGAKESWTRLFKVPNGSGIPLYQRKDGYEFLLPGIQHGLGWYNPREKMIKKVEFHGCEFNGENYYSTKVKTCLESFVHPFVSFERHVAEEVLKAE